MFHAMVFGCLCLDWYNCYLFYECLTMGCIQAMKNVLEIMDKPVADSSVHQYEDFVVLAKLFNNKTIQASPLPIRKMSICCNVCYLY